MNTMVICETPLRDVDVVDSRPSTLFRAVSNGWLNCLSTTSGGGAGHGGHHCDLRELDGRNEFLLERPPHGDHAEHRRKDGDQRDQARFPRDSLAKRNIALTPAVYVTIRLTGTGRSPGCGLALDGVGHFQLQRPGGACFQFRGQVRILVELDAVARHHVLELGLPSLKFLGERLLQQFDHDGHGG